ncbi:glycine-rich protein [Conexibacter stalactiti]|uniref:receptor protein-tyrosine kinase n=1 Tax=Conexibacter stalactiti TaxID=1940611 RepID=A0ABU4HKQ0_9ACTN|nr:glycine-rich protein [Conexibacter stalactiti]MDW5593820.1 hypothetical protein [Conexibacter stalactiti]MEC5034462.1 glycine-rich protein [Conexibacter stalactiti]
MLPAAASAATSQSFTTPGATQFTVPAGVTRIAIDAIGGQGGGALQTPPFRCQGGAGSRVRGTMTVTPGQSFWVVVGGAGGDAMPPIQSSVGGYNGGGNGRSQQWPSGGGGGASDIRTLPVANGLTPTDSRLLVAGGGGGAGGDNRDTCPAGGAGGATPGAGHDGAFGTTGGQPGTQSAGGARGLSALCTTPVASTDGALGVGGIGAYESQSNGLCGGSGAGGGGGRYGGGGGGAGQQSLLYGGGGGGAGSNYTNPARIGDVAITTAAWERTNAPLNGSITIDWTPDSPTASISSPATGSSYAVGQTVATSFSCTDALNGGGITSCVDGAGRTSPGTLDTTTPGSHTYTVTATSASALRGTDSITYTVVAAPRATISAPASGGTYEVGQNVPTAFTCTEGASGPGITTCLDGAGRTSPGRLDTTTPGSHTYTVTATSGSSQRGTDSITYTVAAAPSATITAPATGGTYAVGQNVPTAFTCTEGASGPGITTCLDGAGRTSPGRLDTTTTGSHTYTVRATSGSGQSRTATITYTVADAPSATISAPATGGTYAVGQNVATAFTCADGASGPGITSCLDDAGRTSPATLDTSTPGSHTYTVRATSGSGQTGTATITYTVAAAPSATITAPADGQVYAVGADVATAFTCADGASGPGITSCLDDAGRTSPGRLDTTTTGSHTYTVTATSGSGQRGTDSITYTVARVPTATISAPQDGATFAVGEAVTTSFSCAIGQDGGPIETCEDSDGASGGSGRLDTSRAGRFTYTVDARSDDGLSGSTSIAYTVAEAPRATISAPGDGGTYTVGDRVETAFACVEGAFGPGIASCVDGAGASGTGVLDTTTAGSHSYRVTATSRDGQTASASISYTVVRPADPPARRDPDGPGTPPDGGRAGPNGPNGPNGSGGSGGSGGTPNGPSGTGGTPPSNDVRFTRVRTNADGSLRFTVRFPGRGRAETMLTARKVTLAGASATFTPLASRFAFATGRHTVRRAGLFTLTLRPNRRGRELIARGRGATRLRLWVAFTPTGGRQRKISVFGVRVPAPATAPAGAARDRR